MICVGQSLAFKEVSLYPPSAGLFQRPLAPDPHPRHRASWQCRLWRAAFAESCKNIFRAWTESLKPLTNTIEQAFHFHHIRKVHFIKLTYHHQCQVQTWQRVQWAKQSGEKKIKVGIEYIEQDFLLRRGLSKSAQDKEGGPPNKEIIDSWSFVNERIQCLIIIMLMMIFREQTFWVGRSRSYMASPSSIWSAQLDPISTLRNPVKMNRGFIQEPSEHPQRAPNNLPPPFLLLQVLCMSNLHRDPKIRSGSGSYPSPHALSSLQNLRITKAPKWHF